MLVLAAVPLTCWLCVLVARPRRPLPGSEVQELVYARLLGRLQRLVLLAFCLTGAMVLALLVTVPQRTDADLRAIRQAHADCTAQLAGAARDAAPPKCYELQAGGVWAQVIPRKDGGWQPVGTVSGPVPLDATIHGSKP